MFFLCNLLVFTDTLKRSAPSRIINVSSLTASWAIRTDPDQITNYTCPYRNYATSKLLLIAFTQKLAKTLDNSGISVFSLHPGIIATKLYDSAGKFLGWISGFLINVFYKVGTQNCFLEGTTCVTSFDVDKFD